ncbi:MAG: type II secretion system major pseudopilin GspG [Spirochaetes bacterium]|nr:type II secretion system major pseudopilin GspG [Spirochaetota bacterium]
MQMIIDNIKLYYAHVRRTMSELFRSDGFSLLELLIVIVIIGILGTIVYTRFMDLPERAKIQAAKQQILIFKMAMDRYRLDHDEYPSGEQGLEAIRNYLDSKEVPLDPWGKEYILRVPGENDREYDIISCGPDKQEGTDDDIRSWEIHKKGGASETKNVKQE